MTFSVNPIIEYLAFGLLDPRRRQDKYLREYIEPESTFKIIITFPKSKESEFHEALRCMVLFGGLGSRSRNGFGSLHCSEFSDLAVRKGGELKSFTSFSKEAKLFKDFNTYKTWEDALSEIGKGYREARLNLEERHIFDKRKWIAMPIESKSERNIPQFVRHGRHAKPYFLHVNKTPDGKYQGQILFLPYQYRTGPNDDSNKIDEYLAVCNEMNLNIGMLMGGAQ